MGEIVIINVCILVCLISSIGCLLSRNEARKINRRIEVVRSDLDSRLMSALEDIDELQETMGTCECTDWNKTVTDLIAEQPVQSKSNSIESRADTLQTSEERIMKSFQDEKVARKGFEHKMMDMVKDQIKSPVHGGWTLWDQWGECSQTCDIGFIKRSRQCSNPYPGPNGNPCFGDYTDIKQCALRECTRVHGGWTDWVQWGECSQTCGTGLMKRSRQCSNPYPGPHGNHCFGDFTDTKLCILQECTQVGQQLVIQSNPIVFFSVRSPQQSMVNNVVVFQTKVETSSGNDYSTATGKFTCRIPGLYHFSVKFMSHLKSGSDGYTYCRIRKNNVYKSKAFNSVFGKSGSYRSASSSVYLSLVAGDTVSVAGCGGWDNISKCSAFHFVGALITPS